MADWVECTSYTEDRTPLWINLDHVASIIEHDNGSVLTMSNGEERVISNKPDKILPARTR